MDALKAKIEAARTELAALKAGEQTLEAAEKITALRATLKADEAELATLTEAFSDAEGDEEAAEGGEGEGSEAGEGEGETPAAPAETPAAPAENPAAPAEGEGAGEAPAAPVALAASSAPSPTATEGGEGDVDYVKPMTLTASAGVTGVSPGAKLDRTGVFKVLQAAQRAASQGGTTSGKVELFSMERYGAPTEGLHDGTDVMVATQVLRDARARHLAGKTERPTAITAAGCFCGPDELIRETGVVGERGRPVAGLFPSIAISGGFRAMPDIAFNVDNLGSVVQWTCDDQDDVDPGDDSTWKPCTEIDCFDEATYTPYMVVACTTARRQHRWAHPEQVDRHIDLLGIEYDAVAETILLDILEADAGTPLTIGDTGNKMASHGMLAKLRYALGSLSFSLGYQFREGDGVLDRYTVIAPVGMTRAVLADEQIRGFPSNVRTAAELVSSLEQSYGVRFVERMDESSSKKAAAAATVTALNAGGAIDGATTPLLPPMFRLYVVRTDQWVHGEGTMVDASWEVDDNLRRQNKMRYFLENVEILERLGVAKSHILDVPGVIAGSYSDLVAPPL